jgi:hypothetical protein
MTLCTLLPLSQIATCFDRCMLIAQICHGYACLTLLQLVLTPRVVVVPQDLAADYLVVRISECRKPSAVRSVVVAPQYMRSGCSSTATTCSMLHQISIVWLNECMLCWLKLGTQEIFGQWSLPKFSWIWIHLSKF